MNRPRSLVNPISPRCRLLELSRQLRPKISREVTRNLAITYGFCPYYNPMLLCYCNGIFHLTTKAVDEEHNFQANAPDSLRLFNRQINEGFRVACKLQTQLHLDSPLSLSIIDLQAKNKPQLWPKALRQSCAVLIAGLMRRDIVSKEPSTVKLQCVYLGLVMIEELVVAHPSWEQGQWRGASAARSVAGSDAGLKLR